jgi:hypothetical protein
LLLGCFGKFRRTARHGMAMEVTGFNSFRRKLTGSRGSPRRSGPSDWSGDFRQLELALFAFLQFDRHGKKDNSTSHPDPTELPVSGLESQVLASMHTLS